MIDVKHNGCVYRYCPPSDKQKGYWIGVSGKRRSDNMFSGAFCHVPLGHWPTLRSAAIEQGVCSSVFNTPEKKTKSGKSRGPKKAKGPSISIF